MPSPFLWGGGLSPGIFEECSLFFLAGREKQEKSIHIQKINKFDTEINDVLKDFCQYKTELQTKKTITEVFDL